VREEAPGVTIVLLVLLLSTFAPSAPSASTTSSQTPSKYPATCLEGGTPVPPVPPKVSVAVVKPIFTSTPYSQYPTGSFYAFYKKYHTVTGNITSNLDWLSTRVKSGMTFDSGWGRTYSLYSFLVSQAARSCGLIVGRNLRVITDINVTDGALFKSNGSRAFDAVIIGHQEYVTQAEYTQLRSFVASGGRLIAMSANIFYARVAYDPATGFETFVIGHGWAFNGRSAWHSKAVPFDRNSSGWFGSVFCCFHRFQYTGAVVNTTNPVGSELWLYFGSPLFLDYASHEENAIGNFTRTSIVATFARQSGLVVASYIHRYGKGAVFCLCVFGEDTIGYDRTAQFFLVASVTATFPGSNHQAQQPESFLPIRYVAVVGLALAALAVPTISLLRGRSRAAGETNP
jgi:hypothetical protein